MKFCNKELRARCDCNKFSIFETMFYCKPCDKLSCRNCLSYKISSYSCPKCSAYYPGVDAVNNSFRCKTCKICPICNQNLDVKINRDSGICAYLCGNCMWKVDYKLDQQTEIKAEKVSNFNDLLISQSNYFNEVRDKSILEIKAKELSLSQNMSFNIKSRNFGNSKGSIDDIDPPYISKPYCLEEFRQNISPSFGCTKKMKSQQTPFNTIPAEKSKDINVPLQRLFNNLNYREQIYSFQQIINSLTAQNVEGKNQTITNHILSLNPNELELTEDVTLRPVPLILSSRSTLICNV
ncbi:hypothetical protein HZS_4156 [Henneguya salminicola]|nr:hypothetical protein HZS_4156 [Henneguya salminicola]